MEQDEPMEHDETMEQDQPMEQVEPVEQDKPLVPQRKKRGPNKMKTKPVEPFDVVFNKFGEAINDHQCWFANHIGNITRLRISITHETWRHVPEEHKEALWLNAKQVDYPLELDIFYLFQTIYAKRWKPCVRK